MPANFKTHQLYFTPYSRNELGKADLGNKANSVGKVINVNGRAIITKAGMVFRISISCSFTIIFS